MRYFKKILYHITPTIPTDHVGAICHVFCDIFIHGNDGHVPCGIYNREDERCKIEDTSHLLT